MDLLVEKARAQKNLKKQMDREDVLRHYVLGYILECALLEDKKAIANIKELLVDNLKLISNKNFIYCLYKTKINCCILFKYTRKDYRKLKSMIQIAHKTQEEQIKSFKELENFAKKFKYGIFVKPNMASCSFEYPNIS